MAGLRDMNRKHALGTYSDVPAEDGAHLAALLGSSSGGDWMDELDKIDTTMRGWPGSDKFVGYFVDTDQEVYEVECTFDEMRAARAVNDTAPRESAYWFARLTTGLATAFRELPAESTTTMASLTIERIMDWTLDEVKALTDAQVEDARAVLSPLRGPAHQAISDRYAAFQAAKGGESEVSARAAWVAAIEYDKALGNRYTLLGMQVEQRKRETWAANPESRGHERMRPYSRREKMYHAYDDEDED